MQQPISVHYILALPNGDQVEIARTKSAVIDVAGEGISNVVLPWVESCQWQELPAVSATVTYGDVAIEHHPDGIRLGMIAVSGKVGPLPFDVTNGDGSLRRELADTWVALDMLRNLFKLALSKYGYLHFYALDEGWWYKVVPEGPISIGRGGAAGKIAATYSFALKVVGKIEPPKIDYLSTVIAPKTVAEPTVSAKEEAQAEKFSILGAAAAARTAVEKAIGVVTGPVNSALTYAEDVADEYDEWAGLIVDTAHMPERMVQRALSLADRVIATTEAVKRGTYDYAVDRWFGMKQYASGGVAAPDVGELARAVRAEKATQRDAVAGAYSVSVSARIAMRRGDSLRYPVREGDTIFGIAAAVLGDPNQWRLLAKENDLLPPYRLAPGQSLIIPTVPGTAPLSTLKNAGDLDDEALYGRDFEESVDGDIQTIQREDGVDWALVRGVDCVNQSTRRRLSWERGENLHFVTHGLPATVGRGNTAARSAMFGIDVTNELLSDSRVSRVADVQVGDHGDGWSYEATQVLVNAEEVLVAGGNAR